MADGQQFPAPTQEGHGEGDQATNPASTDDGPAPVPEHRMATATGEDENGEKGRRSERRKARRQAQLSSASGALEKEGEGSKGLGGELPARLARIRSVVNHKSKMAPAVPDLKRYVAQMTRVLWHCVTRSERYIMP